MCVYTYKDRYSRKLSYFLRAMGSMLPLTKNSVPDTISPGSRLGEVCMPAVSCSRRNFSYECDSSRSLYKCGRAERNTRLPMRLSDSQWSGPVVPRSNSR